MTYDTINDAQTIAGSGEGTLLANRYRIVRQLGQGGMGSVWLAEDIQLDNKPFAIKMLPSILVSNKRAYRQLKDEALVVMQLVHSNIVQIRAFEENDGNPFLVMDYIDGQTLDDYLAEKGKLPEADVLRILRPIAAALDYAHSKGVVHRDVKPGNVMIRTDGTPFILDFGIAREIQETMTRVTGNLSSGTLLYMSPEQLMGEKLTPAQDIYSFAAMAYECLKGEPPFSHGQLEFQIMNKMPDPLPEGTQIVASVMSGLAKEPKNRPPSCMAVLRRDVPNRIEHVERRRTPVALSAGARVPGDLPRNGGAWKMLVVLALFVSLAGGTLYYRHQEQNREAARLAAEHKAESERKAEAARRAKEDAERLQREGAERKAEEERKMEAERLAKEKAEAERKSAEERVRRAAETSARNAATEIRIGAKVQKANVEQISDADGFRAKKNALAESFAYADALFDEKVRRWSEAAVLFTNYVNQCKALIALDGERHKARDARAKADAARSRAVVADAEKYAHESWSEAGRLRDDANAEFSRMDFSSAVGTFASAERQFGACVDEARKNALPQLRVTAEINGREVDGARINDGNKEHRAPLVWTLDAGKRYGPYRVSYESAGRRYYGMFDAVTADWHGLKAVSVVLKEEHVGPKTGATRTITLPGGAAMEMIYVAPGTFTMGSPVWEEGRFDSEIQHRVTLTKGYWLGKYEVTQKQWRSVMGNNPSKFRGDNRPVDSVSWEDCQRFIGKLNLQMACRARLPTDAEWEYACRAGTVGPYGGNGNLDDMGWYGGNSGRETHPVGQKRANAWGFHDMHGNVYEWCNDWFGKDYYSNSPAEDPSGPASGEYRVLRGGSWLHITRLCRSASRLGNSSPGLRVQFLGFRLACSE